MPHTVPRSVLSSLSAPISASLAGLSSLSGLSPQTLAAAAKAYRDPVPPPVLPVLHLAPRHTPAEEGASCPHQLAWGLPGEHVKPGWETIEELEDFTVSMATLVRREFDCWVEICWTEAFHYVFTRSLPNYIIDLILAHATPALLRQGVVHGGPKLDRHFQAVVRAHLYAEFELRMAGRRPPSEYGKPDPRVPDGYGVPRDGVCTLDLAQTHGGGVVADDDDHAACMCQLTTCLECFVESSRTRRGPLGLLPLELADTDAADGWTGGIETEAEQRERRAFAIPSTSTAPAPLAPGQGFTRLPKATTSAFRPLFQHPQMTDVLAVEEHIRWRLKELGAPDPSVEARYGPCENSAAALEGLTLPDDQDDEPRERKTVEARVKGKMRKATVRAPAKKNGKPERRCYLPKTWTDEDPQARHLAVVLTYRHYVNLLHRTAVSSSAFAYPGYADDIAALDHAHPVAMYRRLTEPSIARVRLSRSEMQGWTQCMERWTEELGAREKSQGNGYVNAARHAEAVLSYSRAISLDGRKTVYFSNRAVAYNALREHAHAEADCRYILSKDAKNIKAFYQRATARMGLGKWREAEADLRQVLRLSEGQSGARESAERLLVEVKAEVAKLPKQSLRDALEF